MWSPHTAERLRIFGEEYKQSYEPRVNPHDKKKSTVTSHSDPRRVFKVNLNSKNDRQGDELCSCLRPKVLDTLCNHVTSTADKSGVQYQSLIPPSTMTAQWKAQYPLEIEYKVCCCVLCVYVC